MVWRIDLHVHTRRYSPCAELLDPLELPGTMRQVGLDGVVIAEHDHLWSIEERLELQQLLDQFGEPPLRVYAGVELSTAEGHLVALGVEALTNIRRGAPALEVTRQVHHMGGVVILAHPYRTHTPEERQPPYPVELLDELDAAEVCGHSTPAWQRQAAAHLARAHGLAPVAASDAHALETLGKVYTKFPFLPADEGALAQALIQRLGVPHCEELVL